jgi:predicted alpha/beta hydrolase family esterase
MQIVVIHGGNTYETTSDFLKDLWRQLFRMEFRLPWSRVRTKSWKANLQEDLGQEDEDTVFEVIRPKMPNPHNARYEEWKNTFEELLAGPELVGEDEVMLVGYSLGGMFLAKYLSQNKFPKRIKATFLVAAPFDSEQVIKNSEILEKKIPFFAVPDDLARFSAQSPHIFLYHSKDDPIVPFSELAKFQKRLISEKGTADPAVTTRIFDDRQHFNQEHFPELVQDIRHESV